LTRQRWIQFGIALTVVFFISMAVGALIGRSRTAPPVANLPTPTPAVTAVVSQSPTSSTPTAAVTPGGSPIPPTIPPTTPSTAPPTATQASDAPLDPPTAEQFAADLLAAFQTGDTPYLFERLHPFVLERYGERQCRRHVNGFAADPSADWAVLSSSGPAPWDWVTDELTTTVSDTTTVMVHIPGTGDRELHFAPSEGTWRWFLDCGDPR
jgi:hypothetical protein